MNPGADSILDLLPPTVMAVEAIPLEAHTLSNLLDTVQKAWRDKRKGRPERVQYARGGDVLIERKVLASADLPDFLTPYQSVRVNTDLQLREVPAAGALVALCDAMREVGARGSPAQAIVCHSVLKLQAWAGVADLGNVFRVRVYEDPEVPPGVCCFVCGSAEGDMMSDWDASVGIQEG